jgi:hypothetical protein
MVDNIDEDGTVLTLDVNNEFASVHIQSFVNRPLLEDFVGGLQSFSKLATNSKFEFRFGEFGPRAAGGAASFDFQYIGRGQIIVGMLLESPYRDCGSLKIADSASLKFQTQPVLLDNFIAELRQLALCNTNTAIFEGI